MPGRQSTGPAAQKKRRPKKQKKQRSLNALAIAEQQHPGKVNVRRHRLGESEPDETKRKRDVSDDDGDEDDGSQDRKRPRTGEKDRFGNEIEGGSDSEGNAWVTGQVHSDDDSDLDSDEAMGESDEERFEGFTFRGSSSTNHTQKRRGSTSRSINDATRTEDIDLDEGDEDENDLDDESEGFAEEAIDLATMLDDSDDGQLDVPPGSMEHRDNSGDSLSDADDDNSFDERESTLTLSDTEDGTNDTTKLSALQTLVSSLGNGAATKKLQNRQRDAQEAATPTEYGLTPRQKLTVADLLPTITDPKLKKSLKLLSDNSTKVSKRADGIPQKLDVPLAKRQQDRLDRAAAYAKSKETLNRWIDTVKHNRRAEHLSFPLANPDADAAKDVKRLLSSSQAKPMTSLESTIQSILVDSGLAPIDGKSEEEQLQAFEELALNKVPIEVVQARRAELRKARELLFREEIRSKRIKKIKSKSYRRVHRKERERNALRDNEALAAAGADLSEDEQERNDRRRAEERMGARHRESKWAKGIKDSGRAAWDEDARSGVTEMARREEELRRRIAGKDIRQDDGSLGSSSDSSDEDVLSGDDDEEAKNTGRLARKLHQLGESISQELSGPGSRLSSMKFMQKAEAARQEQNNADIARLKRELAGEHSPDESDAIEASGHRSYGPDQNKPAIAKNPQSTNRSEFEERIGSEDDEQEPQAAASDHEVEIITETPGQAIAKATAQTSLPYSQKRSSNKTLSKPKSAPTAEEENPWLHLNFTKSNNRDRRARESDEVLISANPDLSVPALQAPSLLPKSILKRTTTAAPQPKKAHNPKPAPKDPQILPSISPDSDNDSFTGFSSASPSTPPSLPLTNQELINRAFAGDSVLATFAAEKAATAQADAPLTISTALPGWGSWTGDGVSSRERKLTQQRNARYPHNSTTIPGIDPSKRKDAKLERVIVNEKRVKKNAKYLASELPHPYETRAQYERSLRLPVGPEWTTKEVFQRATMPRVLVRKGVVVGAMERPVV
ncbi:hypothetical protein MMC26_007617 [Xylographa opegraphella]|nr:hypothetical protein [Xylographa opegraphella]